MQETLNVLVLADFTDDIMERLKAVSPRYKFTRKTVKSINEVSPDILATTDILYTMSLVPEPDTAPRLRWIQAHTAGVERLLAQPLLASEDIILTTASGVHAVTMAEYTFAMMLAFAHKLPLMLRNQQKAEWPADRLNIFMPLLLRDATLGIVGYGSIGREVGRLAKAFGMHVLASKRDVMHPTAENEYAVPGTGDPDGSAVERLYPPEAVASMVALCDFVLIALPVTGKTTNMINRETLTSMKKGSVLINVARGSVIDEEALIEVLQLGHLGGAGLDVFAQEPLPASSPLWKMDNVIISPHISGNTSHYLEDTSSLFAENLRRYVNNQELLNRVDRKRGY